MKYTRSLPESLVSYSLFIFLSGAVAHTQPLFVNEYTRHVEQFLKRYKRPFTVLCIGNIANTLGLQVASKFKNSTFVLTNENKDSTTLARCFKENPVNIVFLPKLLSPQKFQMLSECEHFDVILAHDLHLYKKDDWKKTLLALLNAGDYVFVTVRNSDDAIKKFLADLGNTVKDMFQADALETFFVECKKNYIERKAWGHYSKQNPGDYEVVSNFKKKSLHKKKGIDKKNPWVHGINLVTLYMLSGSYPLKKDLVEELLALKLIPHNSTNMNNIIIKGKKLQYIDFDRPSHKISYTINNVIAAFRGEKIAYNDPQHKGKIRYRNVR